MDLDQLAQELAMLKSESAAAKEEKRMGNFIDKYGTKFNGNTDIANLILAEMDRRGVDEASEAASEAVQSVLDRLREEATKVLEETKGAMTQVSDLMDKIDDIQASVDAAAGGTGSGGGEVTPPIEEPPAGDMGGGAMAPETPPTDAGALPPAGDPSMGGGEVPTPEAGGGAMPPEGGLAPVTEDPDPGAAPPPDIGASDAGGDAPPPDQMQVPSDVRLKNIRSKFAAYKQSRQQVTVPSDANIKKVWKPRKDTLSVLRGLM